MRETGRHARWTTLLLPLCLFAALAPAGAIPPGPGSAALAGTLPVSAERTPATGPRTGEPAPLPRPSPPPSILLVTFDTLRADRVGCYGYRRAETPHLDRLAREGVRFEEARSHVPLTLPSHATMLTGLLPPRHGVRANGLFRLDARFRTLAVAVRERGWSTGAVVTSVVLDRIYGLNAGFDIYDDNQRVGDRSAFNYLERGASQAEQAAGSVLERLEPPFLLWVHLYDPHAPYVPPEPYRSRHAGRPYDGEIAFADAALGAIRRSAEARAGGRLIVAATADHGESLGEHGEDQHGYTLHRGVLRVPLILAGPGIPRGVTVPETVGLVDLGPTLADLAGAALPGADGASLRRLWAENGSSSPQGGQADRDARTALWEETLHTLYDSGWAPLRGLLTDRWHYVQAPRPELYDRIADPDDRRDVARAHPGAVREMSSRLARFGEALGDVAEPAVTGFSATGVPDPEERELRARLESLGYLSGGADRAAPPARLDPKDGLPGHLAAEASERLLTEGKGKQALERVEPHTRTDPENPRLWSQMGKALVFLGETKRAAEAYRKAIALDPRSEFIRYGYAACLKEAGDTAGARSQLEAILAANPRAVDASLQLAAMAAAAGEPGRAERILGASYDSGARDPELLSALGRFLLARDRPDEASRFFAEALELDPREPVALLETARAALRRGGAARAIELLGRCLDGPRAFECRMERARAFLSGPGDLAAARAHVESARQVAANDGERREAEARLRMLDGMAAPR